MREAPVLPDFIMADISDVSDAPCGRRGYLVIREGTKYVSLLNPYAFKVYRLTFDAWDALAFDRLDYDPSQMRERLRLARDQRERAGKRNGGKAVDLALSWLGGAA